MEDKSQPDEIIDIEIESESSPGSLSLPSDTIYIGAIRSKDVTASGSFDVRAVQALSFTRLLHALPMPAFLVDEFRRIVFANAACREEGNMSSALIGKRLSDIFPTLEAADEVNGLIAHVFSTRQPKETLCEMTFGGKKLWGRIRLRSMRLGSFRAVLMLVENLTHEMERLAAERRHQDRLRKAGEDLEAANAQLRKEMGEREVAEETTRSNQEKYRLLVESAPMGIAFINRDGEVLEVNKALLDVIGVSSPDELQGANMLTQSRLVSTGASDAFRRCMETGRTITQEIRWPLPTGSDAHLSLILTPVLDPGGRSRGFQAVVEDVTARKTAERLALYSHSMQAVSELAEAVAHTFNNLLQTVIGGAQLAVTNLELGSMTDVGDTLESIIQLSHSGAAAVRRLHYLARIQGEAGESFHDGLDLSRITHQAIEMSRPWWKSHPQKDGVKVSLFRHLGPNCLVRGAENELFELVVHLVRNAAEALPEGGAIDVRTYVKDDQVLLEVQDNGVGIPPEDNVKIFEPLWSTKGAMGTGIGLARCKTIVERHKGRICLESAVGKGSLFTVEFPSRKRTESPERIEATPDLDTPLRILIIDDLEPLVRVLRNGLMKAGQIVFPAFSGRRGLEIFKSSQVDVVICDLGMPEMNGWQVAEKVKRACEEEGKPKPPFILLTGWPGSRARKERMAAAGVDRILEKPVDLAQLLAIVRETMEASRKAAPSDPSADPHREAETN